MLVERRAVCQNIIQKNYDVLACCRGEDHVHDTLKCRWSIRHAERHHTKLEMAVVGFEGRFGFVLLAHMYLVVARAQIKLGEEEAPANSLRSSSMIGKGNMFLIVMSLRRR